MAEITAARWRIPAVLAVMALLALGIIQMTATRVQSPPRSVRIGVYAGEASLLLYLAESQGFYRSQGLAVTLVPYPTGRDAMAGLLKGEVDYANCTEFVVVKNSFQGQDFKILASVAEGDINGLLAKKSRGIARGADLKGKTIGITTGTLTEYLAGVFLDQHGLTPEEVTLVHVAHDRRLETMDDPAIDALVAWEPYLYTLRKKHPHELAYFPMPAGFPFYFLLVADGEFHKASAQVAVPLLTALCQAEKWAFHHPDQMNDLAREIFGSSRDYATYSLARHNFEITLPYVLPRIMANQARWLIETQGADGAAPARMADLIDPGPLRAVKPESITLIE